MNRRNKDAIIPYRLRLLYLAKMLYTETDEDNPITLAELEDCLEYDYGQKAQRRTLLEDIQAIDGNLFRVGSVYLSDYRGYGYYRITKEVNHADR